MEEYTRENWIAFIQDRIPKINKDEEEQKLKMHEAKFKQIKSEVNRRFRQKQSAREAKLEREYCDSATRSDDDSDEDLDEFVSGGRVVEPSLKYVRAETENKPQVKPIFSRSIGF